MMISNVGKYHVNIIARKASNPGSVLMLNTKFLGLKYSRNDGLRG
jgi:hypothetical protein